MKFNSDGTFNDRKMSGHQRKTTPNETVMRTPKELRAILRLKLNKRYNDKFQHCFDTCQQRIWTEVPQAGTKSTPDISDEEQETRLCQSSSLLDSH